MRDRPPNNESETQTRRQLVALCREMLAEWLTYCEGTPQVWALHSKVGGVNPEDPDFEAFLLIYSETEGPFFATDSELKKRVEEWAAGFAPDACRNLIARFGGDVS